MDYLIITTEEVHSGLILGLGKNGNQYYVQLYREGNLTNKLCDTIDDAYRIYEVLAKWIVLGLYSEKDRREWLANQ